MNKSFHIFSQNYTVDHVLCYTFVRKYHLIFKKAEVTIMEFKSILIKDTTVEERKQIVKESLGNISASCDGCMARLSEMYDE